MDYVDVRREIEVYLNTNFTLAPIQFENTTIDATTEFIALTISDATAEPPAMGSSSTLISGLLTIQIYTELGVGTQRARELYDKLKLMLLGVNVDGLSFQAPVHSSFGQVEGANYYQTNLDCQFEFIT